MAFSDRSISETSLSELEISLLSATATDELFEELKQPQMSLLILKQSQELILLSGL